MSHDSIPLIRARVCEAAQEVFRLLMDDGAECDAVPAGTLRWSAQLPAVGDWVRARRLDAHLALIESVEPRTTCISRKSPCGGEQVLVSNVDLIVVVMGLDGDYNLRRLERYLVMAAASRAQSLVALNKKDICPDWAARLSEVRAIADDVVALSAKDSVTALSELVRGRTIVLLGSSGAGKSTIANTLLGEDRQATQCVRASDSRGRHTTTRRMLMELPGGGTLIDTPGLREVGLWAGTDTVEEVFGVVAALARQCRFRDCTHSGEPGCAVSEALGNGALEAARWTSYQKLLAEARFHERTVNRNAALEEKRKWKAMHKSLRNHPKYRR